MIYLLIIKSIIGSFKKGHSDKGHHEIHKGDKSGKKEDFFDEDHDEDFDEGKGIIIYSYISIQSIQKS